MQEDIKPLSTENAVTSEGIKVRPKEDVIIVGTGGKHLKADQEYIVHRILAEKLVESGQAIYKDAENAPKKKKGKED